jgi:hypothetical protein
MDAGDFGEQLPSEIIEFCALSPSAIGKQFTTPFLIAISYANSQTLRSHNP